VKINVWIAITAVALAALSGIFLTNAFHKNSHARVYQGTVVFSKDYPPDPKNEVSDSMAISTVLVLEKNTWKRYLKGNVGAHGLYKRIESESGDLEFILLDKNSEEVMTLTVQGDSDNELIWNTTPYKFVRVN